MCISGSAASFCPLCGEAFQQVVGLLEDVEPKLLTMMLAVETCGVQLLPVSNMDSERPEQFISSQRISRAG
jgi:hypothetical protein